MKFNLEHDPANRAVFLPYAALQVSKLAGKSRIAYHLDTGCVLLLPERPNAEELLKTIRLLNGVTSGLTRELALRSQQIMETEMEKTDCGGCDTDCEGLSIPPCQLAEAGIGTNTALESFVEKGRVIVQAAEKSDAERLIDSLGAGLRTMLENSGVQIGGVFRLLESEGYRDE